VISVRRAPIRKGRSNFLSHSLCSRQKVLDYSGLASSRALARGRQHALPLVFSVSIFREIPEVVVPPGVPSRQPLLARGVFFWIFLVLVPWPSSPTKKWLMPPCFRWAIFTVPPRVCESEGLFRAFPAADRVSAFRRALFGGYTLDGFTGPTDDLAPLLCASSTSSGVLHKSLL